MKSKSPLDDYAQVFYSYVKIDIFMNPFIGFFKPTSFFNWLCNKTTQEQTDSLLKCMIFLTSFVVISVYVATPIALETFGYLAKPDIAVTMAFKSGLWIFTFLFLQGLMNSVIGMLFKVNEHPFQVTLCHLWASVFGFVALILCTLSAVALGTALHSLQIEQGLTAALVIVLLTLKLWYMFLGIRVSMQTTPLESHVVLFGSFLLTMSLKWCIDSVVNHFLA